MPATVIDGRDHRVERIAVSAAIVCQAIGTDATDPRLRLGPRDRDLDPVPDPVVTREGATMRSAVSAADG